MFYVAEMSHLLSSSVVRKFLRKTFCSWLNFVSEKRRVTQDMWITIALMEYVKCFMRKYKALVTTVYSHICMCMYAFVYRCVVCIHRVQDTWCHHRFHHQRSPTLILLTSQCMKMTMSV